MRIHEESIVVQGFKFPDAEASWVFERKDIEVRSIGQLLAKFYEEYSYSTVPLVWTRDPENSEGTPFYGDNVIVVIYRRNFYIVIEKQFREVYGPHPARLFYKSRQTEEVVWIAIVQIEAMFYSDEQMQQSLASVLDGKQLYQSEKTAEIIVHA